MIFITRKHLNNYIESRVKQELRNQKTSIILDTERQILRTLCTTLNNQVVQDKRGRNIYDEQ